MASVRPKRERKPVVRLGFDDGSSDDGEEAGDFEEDPDAPLESDSESSESESSASEAGPAAVPMEVDADGDGNHDMWVRVYPHNDNAPQKVFDVPTGWRDGVNPLPETVQDYVDIFLPYELMSNLATWTNKRALIESVVRAEWEDDDKIADVDFEWKEVDAREMRVFIGVTLMMGIVRKPGVDDYWSTESILRTPYPADCISRNRYKQILKFIRFSDPYLVDKENRSTRLNQFEEMMLSLCNLFIPGQLLSLDESLLLHKGKLKFKMFIRTKRARFGIKIFILCDHSGYMLAHIVYYGAATDFGEIEDLSKSEIIVVQLLEKAGLLEKWYLVTLDNWYSSVRLAEYLFRRSTFMRGTIRPNRGIPQQLKNLQLPVHGTGYYRKDDTVLAIKYVDKKDIYAISTFDKAGEIMKTRHVRGEGQVEYPKPLAIENYNSTMGGVDVTDQYLAGVGILRKNQIWFKKLGLHFVQRLLLNAFIRYKAERIGEGRYSLVKFTLDVIPYLTDVASDVTRGRQLRPARNREEQGHFPEDVPSAGQTRKRLKCQYCSSQGTRKDTYYRCGGCPRKPGLCITPCFRLFHTT